MNYCFPQMPKHPIQARGAILADMYNYTALGWPPFLNQVEVLNTPQWMADMLMGREL